MEHHSTILLTFSTETEFCNLNSGKSTLATHTFLCDLVTLYWSQHIRFLIISTVQQILNRVWMDLCSTSARSRQNLKSQVEGDKWTISMLTNFKKDFAHLLLCGYTASKKSDYWHGKTRRQGVITAYLDLPRPLQLCLSDANLFKFTHSHLFY